MFRIIFFSLLIHSSTQSFDLTENEKAIIKSDIDYLTNGVSKLKQLHGRPTDLRPFGKFAYPLANTSSLKKVWSAARYGNGKICAFSSNDFCRMDGKMLAMADNTRMMENCINWITNQTTSPSKQQPVGIITTAQVFNNNFAKSPNTAFQTLSNLEGINFLLLDQKTVDGFSANQIQVVKEFVSKRGGGLFVCNEPWSTNDLALGDNNGNQLLFEAGLLWLNQPDPTHADIGINPNLPNLFDKNIWYQAKKILESKTPEADDCHHYSFFLAVEFLYANKVPAAMRYVNAFNVVSVFKSCCGHMNYEQSSFPIFKHTNLKGYNCVLFTHKIRYMLPLNYDHPMVKAAKVFPGYPNTTRKTVTVEVPFQLNHTRWHSTGLFVWPGSVLQVQVPAMLVNAGYNIQIGSHTRKLFAKVLDYKRWPWAVEHFPINNAAINWFSFTGGLLYLDVPRRTWENVTVILTGEVVSAPWFRLGITTESQWNDIVSKNVVSFAEIESTVIIVTVHVGSFKYIENITKTALFNDYNVLMNYDLRGNPYKGYKERITADKQIDCSCWMAGYPIQGAEYNSYGYGWSRDFITPTDDVSISNDYQRKVGYWAKYHELGHNFQLGGWTPHGELEVTVNIFALHNEEKYPDGPNQFGSRDFTHLPAGHGKLNFYIQLRHAFGWQAFKQFFRIFENNSTLGSSGNGKAVDNWLMYFSQTVKRNIYSLLNEYHKEYHRPSANAIAYASKFDDWNVSNIVGCQGAAFDNSPCMTARVLFPGLVHFTATMWARINYTESLELTFPDAPNGANVEYEGAAFSSAVYNATSKIIRLTPQKRISQEDKFEFFLKMMPQFQMNDVKVKIVDNAANKLLHVAERSLEQIIYGKN